MGVPSDEQNTRFDRKCRDALSVVLTFINRRVVRKLRSAARVFRDRGLGGFASRRVAAVRLAGLPNSAPVLTALRGGNLDAIVVIPRVPRP